MEPNFNELVSRLRSAFGDQLVSVITFGTAIAAPGNARKSDYQVMVVTTRLMADEVRQMSGIARWWTGQGYMLPAIFTATEFERSLDVFPIEFRHIRHAYRVLYGRDLIAGLEVPSSNLRWQTEYELRGKLMRLRGLAMTSHDSPEQLIELMTESIVSFIQFLRPVLELHGEEPPLGRSKTIDRIGVILEIDTTVLRRILKLREEPVKLMEVEVQDLFAGYLETLTRVIDRVDRFLH